MRGLMFFLAVIAIGAVKVTDAQEVPLFLIPPPPEWVDVLHTEYPEFAKHETKWVYDQLQPIGPPKYGERWFKEMRACLVDEGYELRDHVDFKDIKFHLFREGWSFRDHRGVQVRGVWYPGIIVLEEATGRTEKTIRHEMIHELIGLTHHPLTAMIVGKCQPQLMLDEVEDARFTSPRRTFPFGRFGFPLERVGPRSSPRDGVMGGAGVQLGPLGHPRGAGVLP